MGTKYSTKSTSNYNATPPSDDGSQVDSNLVKWSHVKEKIGDVLKTFAESINSAIVDHVNEGPLTKSASYTTTLADYAKVIEATGTSTVISLLNPSGNAGYKVTVKNANTADQRAGYPLAGAGRIEVDVDGGAAVETHSGATEIYLASGESATFRVNAAGTAYYSEGGGFGVTQGVVRPNHIVNSSFWHWPFGTAISSTTGNTNADTNFFCAQWRLLVSGADAVDMDQHDGQSADGLHLGCRATFQAAGANQQFAIMQMLEHNTVPHFHDLFLEASTRGVASLSFLAKGTGITHLRAAIISWNGAVDNYSADPIATWNTGTTDPQLGANFAYENTPSQLSLTTSYQRFRIENVPIDTSGIANLGVLIWSADADAADGDDVDISQVKLEASAVCTPYQSQVHAVEYHDTLRYVWTTYPQGQDHATGTESGAFFYNAQQASATGQVSFTVQNPVPMRRVPDVTVRSTEASATAARVRNNSGTPADLTVSTSNRNANMVKVQVDSGTVNAGDSISFQILVDGSF